MSEIIKQVPKSGYLSLQQFRGKIIKITEMEITEKKNENTLEVKS